MGLRITPSVSDVLPSEGQHKLAHTAAQRSVPEAVPDEKQAAVEWYKEPERKPSLRLPRDLPWAVVASLNPPTDIITDAEYERTKSKLTEPASLSALPEWPSSMQAQRGDAQSTTQLQGQAARHTSHSYSIYIYKVLKQVHPDIGISKKV